MRDFDYVIVGGGSAGCVLANRLSEDENVSVCLIETGPKDNSEASELSFGPVSIKQTDTFSSSDNLFASTQPADPPPTIT